MKVEGCHRWPHVLLLLVWCILGLGLRLSGLTLKAPWTDEILTLIYSAGRDLREFPLDQVISLNTLLGWLHLDHNVGANEITQRIFGVSVHPPLYFIAVHYWMALFGTEADQISLGVARLLPALLGSVLVPAAFGLGWLAVRSLRAAHLAAMMMALSPFGIYLSQEARHYTLAMVWVMASLACFVMAVRALDHRRALSIGWGLSWISVNTLGIATHFFMLITLGAEALTLVGFGLVHNRYQPQAWVQTHWRRIYLVALGTAVGGLVWLPILPLIQSHQITQWIQTGNRWSFTALTNPMFQLVAAWITMLSLLPVESEQLPIVVLSGSIMLIFFMWAIPRLWYGLVVQWHQPEGRLALQTLGGFVVAAIALFLVITYGLGTDLTRGARYNFVYFPAVIVLIGAGLATDWPSRTEQSQEPNEMSMPGQRQQHRGRYLGFLGRRAVILVGVMGLASAVTVVTNLGYQKYYRPDVLVSLIHATSSAPVLIASTQTTAVQIGDVIAIGWEFQQDESKQQSPSFLLAHQDRKRCHHNCAATEILGQKLDQLPRPFDVWLVNFRAPAELERHHCNLHANANIHIDGYTYQAYQCL